MAYYAEIENGKVKQVLVINDAWTNEQATKWLKANVSDNEWMETKIDGSVRDRYAGIGYEYHKDLDSFILPKPFESWQLDVQTKEYKAPIEMPKDDKLYRWEESAKQWKEIPEEVLANVK